MTDLFESFLKEDMTDTSESFLKVRTLDRYVPQGRHVRYLRHVNV
jgi:hypothetical protein